jgi:hypothetical protein
MPADVDLRRSKFVFDLGRSRRGKLIAKTPAILPEKADLHLSLKSRRTPWKPYRQGAIVSGMTWDTSEGCNHTVWHLSACMEG